MTTQSRFYSAPAHIRQHTPLAKKPRLNWAKVSSVAACTLGTIVFVLAYGFAGASDFEGLQLIEQLKQEQRERIRDAAATSEAYRDFYNIKVEDLQ